MLQITCPFCGPRAESEFTCGGEGGIVRPLHTEALDDRQWADYVFMRHNPKGWQDRKSTRLNSSHSQQSRMPSSA